MKKKIRQKNEDNLKIFAIGFLGLLVASLLTGCGTLSKYKCSKYIGPEKEACIKRHEELSRQMDYQMFRGGGPSPVVIMR